MAKKKKLYWGETQEIGIENFITEDDKKMQEFYYKEIVQPAFKELIQNIYYTWNFNTIFPEYTSIEHETLSHLYEKITNINKEKFLSYEKKNKAFSYFGTITKRFLITQTRKENKKERLETIDHDKHVVSNSIINHKDNVKNYHDRELIGFLSGNLYSEIKNHKSMTDLDLEVAYIIEKIIQDYDNFDITNKKQLYVYIKEAVDIPTRKITISINKIRTVYEEIKGDLGYR